MPGLPGHWSPEQRQLSSAESPFKFPLKPLVPLKAPLQAPFEAAPQASPSTKGNGTIQWISSNMADKTCEDPQAGDLQIFSLTFFQDFQEFPHKRN